MDSIRYRGEQYRMSINKYQAFVTTVEQRSITRAASKLGYTQAGISHLISALESDLGVPLLIRSKTGTVLTPEGADLLPYVQRLLSMNEDIRNKALDLRGLTAGSLRIGTFSSVAIHLLPQILSQFRDRYPGVEVSILNGDYAAVESALLGNTVDCGFVTLPSREEFTVIPLIRDRLMAVVDADSPLVQAPELDPADLQNDTFIIPAEGSNYNIGKLFAQAGITPRKWLNINDDYAAVVMVRRKLGITILPELMVHNLPMQGLRAIPLRGSERQIGFATHRNRFLSPAVRAFTKVVHQSLEHY